MAEDSYNVFMVVLGCVVLQKGTPLHHTDVTVLLGEIWSETTKLHCTAGKKAQELMLNPCTKYKTSFIVFWPSGRTLTPMAYFMPQASGTRPIFNAFITFAGLLWELKITHLANKVPHFVEGSFPADLRFRPVGIEWLAGSRTRRHAALIWKYNWAQQSALWLLWWIMSRLG